MSNRNHQFTYRGFKKNLQSILDRIKDAVNVEKSMEIVFFEVMKDNVDYFRNLGFIRYINIFNNVEKNKVGNVEFYADFIHTPDTISSGKKLITNKREEIDIGDNSKLFDKTNFTIGKLLRKKREFGESYEYIKNDKTSTRIELEWDYFTQRHENKNPEYTHKGIGVFFRKNKTLKQHFEDWLQELNVCYNVDDNGVTNFIFFIGPMYYDGKNNDENGGIEQDFEKYVISANIGINTSSNQKKTISRFLQAFRIFIDQLSYNLSRDIYKYQNKQTAVKSSLAQVMARNMSHNIGSHVLSNLIDDKTYEKLRDEEVTNVLNSFISEINVISEGKNLQVPYFFQYLKSRMDYLSEVTFTTSNMATTKMLYDDVIKEFDRVRILLNYISGIRGFKYQIKARYNGKELNDNNDIGVSFVGDTLSTHAFMVILENQIRNTSKHSSNKEDITTFTINIKDFKCDEVEGSVNYYCVEIDNGVKEDNINQLVEHQNKLLNESLLDANNQLRDHSLGLLEMETSAAFIRQMELPDIESDDYYIDNNDNYFHERNGIKRLNIIKAFRSGDALGYRFFIPKPQEFLFVGKWNGISEAKRINLLNLGIQFIEDQDFIISMGKGTSYSHQFLFYRDNVTNAVRELLSETNDCRALLPLRKLQVAQNKVAVITEILNKHEDRLIVDELKKNSWKWYYEDFLFSELINPINHKIDIFTATDFTDTDSCNQVVFLHHSSKNDHLKTWDDSCKQKNLEAWIENLSSRTWAKLPQFNSYAYTAGTEDPVGSYADNIPNWIRLSIFEAYHNKVIALDERIQRFSKENFEGSDRKDGGGLIPCSNLFESTNVLIPPMILDPINYSAKQIEEIENFINANLKDAFLLLHYGILERMYKSEDNINKKLSAWAKKAKKIVLTSGRGSHSLNLPDYVCFTSLSSVLNVFNESRNKYCINYLLNQSRRKKS